VANRQSTRAANLLEITYRYPSLERLTRLRAWFAGPIEAPSRQACLAGINQAIMMQSGDELRTLWGSDTPWLLLTNRGKPQDVQGMRAHVAIPLALLGTLLADQRPVPKDMATQYAALQKQQQDQWAVPGTPPMVLKQVASDLRVCDIAAVLFTQARRWSFNLNEIMEEDALAQVKMVEKLRIDLSAGIPARNAIIIPIRLLIAQALPPALTAAGLPAVLPGITDYGAGGDNK
jgi:hypothetical protein